MIRRAFHSWERRLAAAAENRTVRPFDWGVEWIPDLAGSNGNPASHLAEWADRTVRQSSDFYAVTPAEYRVRGEWLTFPSAVVTPHEENNTVVILPPEEPKGKEV